MEFWNRFAAKHPETAKWVREGGLFVIVSNLITVFKYLLLQFLPKAFASLPVVDFGWPGIPVTLFGETFQWNILGYDAAHGGLPYFCAYMIANQPIIISIDDVADIIDVRAEDEFARVELLVSLKQELERLSPRELMIIRTYLDYPIEVVARKLKVRPNTISKARRKIARELRKKLV